MTNSVDHKGLIERPDGSTIHFKKLSPAKQLEHELVMRLCAKAYDFNSDLTEFKRMAITEMMAVRDMMFKDHGVKKGGAEGNLSLRSACGRMMVKVTVSKQITFGSELETAKALIDQFMEAELAKGGSDYIKEIVEKVFKLNAKGRIDTGGILGLLEHKFDDQTWSDAMDTIRSAISRDMSTTYINFFQVDLEEPDKGKAEQRIALDLAKV